MATVVFMKTQVQSGAVRFDIEDPVSMVADGAEVGLKVDPATNPASPFALVMVPGTPVADLMYSVESEYGPIVGEVAPLVRKRKYTMDPALLPPTQRTLHENGDGIILTEAEYVTAVVVKP